MLSFERLKELKSWVSDLRKFGVSEGNEIIVLIDAAIARQSVKSEDVQEAIGWAQGMEILYEEKQMPECADCAKTAVVALQEYQKPKPDCESAEKCGDKCCGYGKSEYDDEPIDVCKDCEKQVSYGEE